VLQIIGWILCLYLVVKACELLSMRTNDHRLAPPVAVIGAILALLGAVAFFLLINEQVQQSSLQQQQIKSNFDSLPVP
jgi:hypothetical protein